MKYKVITDKGKSKPMSKEDAFELADKENAAGNPARVVDDNGKEIVDMTAEEILRREG